MCIISEVLFLYPTLEAMVMHDDPGLVILSKGASSAETKQLSLFKEVVLF